MKAPNVLSNRTSVAFIRSALVATGLSLVAADSTRADRLVGVARFTGEVIEIDPATGDSLKRVAVTPPSMCMAEMDDGMFGEEEGKVRAMTRQPNTGTIYGIVRGNLLVKIDPTAELPAMITYVASIPGLSSISSITFTTSNQLFAIVDGRDSAAGVAGSIHGIDLTTGIPTPTGWATSGVGGHAIAYNPNDARIYHFYSSGRSGADPDGLEKINPNDGSSTEVILTGDGYGAVNGLVFTGTVFYGYDNLNENVLSITPAGVVSGSSNPGVTVQALEWDSPSLIAVDNINKEVFRLNPGTGAQSDVMAYRFLPFPCPPSLYSIARDRDTDTNYVIIDSDFPILDHADTLATINVDTGALTGKVQLTENHIAGITVGPGSQIYGVIGGGNNTLPGGTIVMIDKTNGTVTDTGWASTKGSGGQSLEFNPDDGMLYHFFDDSAMVVKTKMEKIDPDTEVVTPIGGVNPSNDGSIIGVGYRGSGQFYATDNTGHFYDIDIGSDLDTLGEVDSTVSGLELVPDAVDPNVARKVKLRKRIRALTEKITIAKKKRQNAKVRRLREVKRKLRKKLQSL